jgi:hypothetical protein
MASGTDEKAKMEGLTSAAAFVEGGIQDACDDACSICLEAFCESDPSTVRCLIFNCMFFLIYDILLTILLCFFVM